MGLISLSQGVRQPNQTEWPQLEAAGYQRCYTQGCPFWISPETMAMVQNQMGGYYSCPVCNRSYDLMSHLPWHGASYDDAQEAQQRDQQASGFKAGGGTKIGIMMSEQAQIGEDLVASIGSLGEYGPITWWHPGGATSPSPLDGAVKDWGIEVKTIGYDAMHHRFVPGGKRVNKDGTTLDEKFEKNRQAIEMGKLGVLGVLVLLDYRRSVADIYVREYPAEKGVGAFRSKNGTHLVKEVPFKNPLMDPHSPAPHVQAGASEEPLGF